MTPLTTPLPNTLSVDADMAEQANPGHGIPSQDPDAAAQTPLEPQDVEREANSVLVGGGAMAGAATGAAIGVAVAGPVGVLVGVSLGAVVGAVGGAAVGASANAEESSSDHIASTDTHGDVRPWA